jgi:GntR family transcriptional regulator/MocR family aminotransferase
LGARGIYETLKEQIRGGAYGSDGHLPSSRALAGQLAVSRTTVTAAYEQLAAEGFIDIRQGARPRVAPAVVDEALATKVRRPSGPVRISAYAERLLQVPNVFCDAPRDRVADFHYGDLATADFPALAWKRAIVAAVTRRPDRLAYDDPRGARELRTALQGYLWRARMLRCEPEQIIIVNGSQQALDLCARLLLDPGDQFAIENPCYAMARDIFSATGAKLISIPVDGKGLDTDFLAKIEARLAYVTPSHQFPLGGVMPIGRRHQLLAWARQTGAYVIEDDYDAEYRYDINPVPPLYGLEDIENVVYVGTVSKTLSPSLRIGYLVVPPGLQQTFAIAKQLADRHAPVLEQAAFAAFIESGAYESHVRKMRRRNGERRATLLNALRHRFGDRIAIEGADAGLHVVVWFRELPRIMECVLIEEARKKGVGVHVVSGLYDKHLPGDMPGEIGLVMGYASLDERQIEHGVDILAEVVDHLCKLPPRGGRDPA